MSKKTIEDGGDADESSVDEIDNWNSSEEEDGEDAEESDTSYELYASVKCSFHYGSL